MSRLTTTVTIRENTNAQNATYKNGSSDGNNDSPTKLKLPEQRTPSNRPAKPPHALARRQNTPRTSTASVGPWNRENNVCMAV